MKPVVGSRRISEVVAVAGSSSGYYAHMKNSRPKGGKEKEKEAEILNH